MNSLCCKRFNSPLYRARDGMVFGVAKGLSRYAELPAIWIRVALIVTFFLSGFFPVAVLYILAAFFMRPEPVIPPVTDEDLEFYNSYTSSRSLALARLKRKFENLERRTRRIETMVTAREFDWDRRLQSGH